jgi:hypothetical protein
MLRDGSLVDGRVAADVDLSESNVQAEVSEPLEVSLEVGGHGADNEVGLEADTIDELLLDQLLDDVVQGS